MPDVRSCSVKIFNTARNLERLRLRTHLVARQIEGGVTDMRSRMVFCLLLAASAAAGASLPAQDWPMFGGNVESTSANASPTGITAANVARLARRQIKLAGTVDASAIYLQGVTVHGALHNAIFVTTTYGKTLALDAI